MINLSKELSKFTEQQFDTEFETTLHEYIIDFLKQNDLPVSDDQDENVAIVFGEPELSVGFAIYLLTHITAQRLNDNPSTLLLNYLNPNESVTH